MEKSVGAIAGMGYTTNCKAKDLDYESDDSWYCGVFATLSGENEKEFKDRMLHNMDRIRGSLANIETGIAEIQRGQQAIYTRFRPPQRDNDQTPIRVASAPSSWLYAGSQVSTSVRLISSARRRGDGDERAMRCPWRRWGMRRHDRRSSWRACGAQLSAASSRRGGKTLPQGTRHSRPGGGTLRAGTAASQRGRRILPQGADASA